MALAVAPDGRTLYVATNPGSEKEAEQPRPFKITAIDTATSRVRASLPWKVPPRYLTMAPDGKTLWVVSTTGEEWTTADNTVTPVDVATFQPGLSLRTSGWRNHQSSPTAAAISPDSRTLYIAVRNGLETFRVPLPTRPKPHAPAPKVIFAVDELALTTRFDTLRGECYRVSESLALIKEMAELWTAGASPLTRTRTAASA